jgi:hypothetical protein
MPGGGRRRHDPNVDRDAVVQADSRGRHRPPAARSSSSTPTSIPTKPRTSATCATPCWATPSSACCARAATTSRCRTTSTTPACRWPTWWWASISSKRKRPAEVAALMPIGARASITLLGPLRAHFAAITKTIPEALAWRAETLHAIEAGEGELAELAHLVADAIVNAHLATMLRLNIQYDVLPRESEILHLQFWAAAFEQLKERKAIYFEKPKARTSGCWVMPSSAFAARRSQRRQQGDRALQRHRDLRRQGHRLSALEVRPAGQGFLLPAALTLRRRAQVWVSTDQPQPRPAPLRQRAHAFTT